MKVCIDIQAAIAQGAGIGRYTKALVANLGTYREKDELSLFFFDFKRKGVPFEIPHAVTRSVTWCPGRVAQKVWKTFDWPPYDFFSGQADLYHFTNYLHPPLRTGKSIANIYDVAFIRHPETLESGNYKTLTTQLHKSIKRSDAIITISEFSAGEIHELLDVPKDKIFTTHLGITPNMRAPDDVTVEAALRLLGITRPYLLFVGTFEPRKNIPFLVDVFDALTGFDGSLVLAGGTGWKSDAIFERINRSPKASSIHHLEYVDEAHLPALYAGAEIFLFPSLYEGFGFPPLEAMACGTPVVSSNAGSLPEVLGDAAVTLDPADVESWREAVENLLSDSTICAGASGRGIARATEYTWSKTALATWSIYRSVAGT